jgi:hypothetical protein
VDLLGVIGLSEIKALKELREWAEQFCSMGKHDPLMFADKIQAEVDERFIELPLDADGAPIHVGDEMSQNGVKLGYVTAVGYNKESRAWVLPYGKNVSIPFIASGIKHVKQRPVEDVLDDLVNDNAWDKAGDFEETKREIIAKYADEIRELAKEGSL